MDDGIEFFTATCMNWQPLPADDEQKEIVMDSLRFWSMTTEEYHLFRQRGISS